MNVWGRALKLFGWSVDIDAPRRNKCVICVAPHTSNLDFIIGLAAYKSLGRQANFLMKKEWFFPPLGWLLRSLGGVPVNRQKGTSLTATLIEKFKTSDYLNLAVTPEGTRSRNPEWHTGFIRIAYGAEVPIQLGIIDFALKRVIIHEEINPTGDIEADLRRVKDYYRPYAGAARRPDQFAL